MHAHGPLTRNVKMCFTFADGDKRRGRVINFTSNGGINDSPIDEYQGALRMQADKEAQIRCVNRSGSRLGMLTVDIEKSRHVLNKFGRKCVI